MQRLHVLGSLLIVVATFWGAGLARAATAPCPDLSSATKDQIIRLARFRYKLSDAVRLTVESEPLANCFYQVRLRSLAPSEGFLKRFTITPDRIYAVTEVVDLRKDPAEEARERNKAFALRLSPETAPVRGNKDGQVSIVIFSDFQCPFCKQAANILNAGWAAENKDAKLVFRQFPLPMHNWARAAAEASVCAARQSGDLFWMAHDFLFENQGQLSQSNLIEKLEKELQRAPAFEQRAFRQCVETGAAKQAVQADVEFGLDNKIDATPTVFVNGMKVNWAANPDQVKRLIRQAAKMIATDSISR